MAIDLWKISLINLRTKCIFLLQKVELKLNWITKPICASLRVCNDQPLVPGHHLTTGQDLRRKCAWCVQVHPHRAYCEALFFKISFMWRWRNGQQWLLIHLQSQLPLPRLKKQWQCHSCNQNHIKMIYVHQCLLSVVFWLQICPCCRYSTTLGTRGSLAARLARRLVARCKCKKHMRRVIWPRESLWHPGYYSTHKQKVQHNNRACCKVSSL